VCRGSDLGLSDFLVESRRRARSRSGLVAIAAPRRSRLESFAVAIDPRSSPDHKNKSGDEGMRVLFAASLGLIAACLGKTATTPARQQEQTTQLKRRCRCPRLNPVAAFTAVLCLIGGFQVWAFIQSERAFLSISAANILSTGNDSPLIIGFELSNGGRSVATGHINFYSRMRSLPSTPDYSNPLIMAYSPVVAGGIDRPSINVPLPSSDIAEIRGGQQPFFIYGIIYFSDVFTFFGPKQVGFCLRFREINAPPVVSFFGTCTESAYSFAR
jgi:hypothetical protein